MENRSYSSLFTSYFIFISFVIGLIPFLACFETYILKRTAHHVDQTHCGYYDAVASKLTEYFAQQENEIMNKFFSLGSLTLESWQQWKLACEKNFSTFEQQCKKACIGHHQAPATTLVHKVQLLLQKYGHEQLNIVPSTEWLMSAYDSFITINDRDVAHDRWLEHHVLHELEHIKNRDFFIGYCMHEWLLCNGNKISKQKTDAFFKQFNHFKETRAELFALLNKKMTNKESHYAYIKRYQQHCFGRRSYNDATHNHPSSGYLYEKIEWLLELMRSEY